MPEEGGGNVNTFENKNAENIFGIRLKTLRKEIRKQTQIEFADFMGISQSTLSAYESGRNKPTLEMAILIADKCHVSIDWLCGRGGRVQLHSLGDLLDVFFQIYEAQEFSCEVEIHGSSSSEIKCVADDERNSWVRLIYFSDGKWGGLRQTYPAEICRMLKKAYDLHKEFSYYDCTKDYYEAKKRELITRYGEYPLTAKTFPELTEDERRSLRLEKLRTELEREADS